MGRSDSFEDDLILCDKKQGQAYTDDVQWLTPLNLFPESAGFFTLFVQWGETQVVHVGKPRCVNHLFWEHVPLIKPCRREIFRVVNDRADGNPFLLRPTLCEFLWGRFERPTVK